MKVKYLLSVWIVSVMLLAWYSFAGSRNLPGIDLVTRAEWWADETWRFAEQPAYQAMIAAREAWADELQQMKEDDFDAYLAEKDKEYKRQMANDYLMSNFEDEYSLDSQNKYYEGHELWQTESFKEDKSKIVIHHTADTATFGDKGDVIAYMHKTYKFHAFTRGWWDIGYNFLIDPFGNIYEGRAGGEDVVATHAAWNNSPSIGIALMGNFEVQNPTDKQKAALVKLLTALSAKYNIDPEGKVSYHRTSKVDPYLETRVDYAIAGHTDAGFTACPGEHLYELLPSIRTQVKKNLFNYQLVNRNTSRDITLPWFQYSSSNTANLQLDVDIDSIRSCSSLQSEISLQQCKIYNGKLNLSFSKTGRASWRKKFLIKDTSGNEYNIAVTILWQSDLDPIVQTVRNMFFKRHSTPTSVAQSKIAHKITIDEAKQYLQQKIRVLLHELSRNYDTWEISCPNTCNFVLDQDVQVAGSGTVKIRDNHVVLEVGDKLSIGSVLHISSEDNLVTVDSYNRSSYAGIPWNSFRGTLTVMEDEIYNKKTDAFDTQFVMINTLDFDDYLKGIVETNDTEHVEKNKVMAMIAKSYALFYMHPDNKQPNIPNSAQYNAIDDPDLYQKYVWAGLEKTLKKWYQALEQTKDKLIVYNGYVPILPYFNCSAGFTYTAQEKRWWTDTPYLESRLDFARCSDFNGHGVGLAGQGAQWWAEKWRSRMEIINYYYDGVRVVNL